MSQTNSSFRLAPWQAMTMLAVGIAIGSVQSKY